jgi:hypothetical protein
LDSNGSQFYKDALVALLKNEIREISSLKKLVVLDGYDDETPLGCAQGMTEWFQECTYKRAREAAEEERKRVYSEKNKKVGFECELYGEGHIWTECYNFCNFYGNFGCLRKRSLKLRA